MSKKFRRAFIGYRTKAVARQLEDVADIGEQQVDEKRCALDKLMLENRTLTEERDALLKSLEERGSLNSALQSLLFKSFTEGFRPLYDIESELLETVAVKSGALSAQKCKSSEIRKRIKEFAVRMEAELSVGSERY